MSTVSGDAALTWLSFSLGAFKILRSLRPMRYSPPSRRPMQPRPDPRRRLVLADMEHASGRLGP